MHVHGLPVPRQWPVDIVCEKGGGGSELIFTFDNKDGRNRVLLEPNEIFRSSLYIKTIKLLCKQNTLPLQNVKWLLRKVIA